MFKAS